MDVPPKRAAIDIEEMAEKRLSEISAAEFLQLLEQVGERGGQANPEEAKVKDVLLGARAALGLPGGGWPEKKKVELEKFPPEQLPEKKKVELEKMMPEQLPEKKKVELEKAYIENFPEKKKVELEKPPAVEKSSVEVPPDLLSEVRNLADRMAAIEEQLSRLER